MILSPRWMLVKALLFVVMATMAAVLLLVAIQSWLTIALVVVLVWAACRTYYFAFYVIEHYVDAEYRFAGLVDCLRWLWRGGAKKLWQAKGGPNRS